jgi:hypothetical protein
METDIHVDNLSLGRRISNPEKYLFLLDQKPLLPSHQNREKKYRKRPSLN